MGGVTVTRSTDSTHGSSVLATRRRVHANFHFDPSAVMGFTHPHTFTITLNALPGNQTASNFSITPSGATFTANTCASPTVALNGLSASCTVTVNSSTVQTVTVNATGHVTMGGVTVTRSTDSTHGSSGPATKSWVDANIQIAPNGVNEVGHAHTFTIVVTALPGTATPVSFGSIGTTVSPAPATSSSTCDAPVVSGNTA